MRGEPHKYRRSYWVSILVGRLVECGRSARPPQKSGASDNLVIPLPWLCGCGTTVYIYMTHSFCGVLAGNHAGRICLSACGVCLQSGVDGAPRLAFPCAGRQRDRSHVHRLAAGERGRGGISWCFFF